MAPERQPEGIQLTGMHINFIDHIVTLEATDGRRAKLAFGEPTTLFEARPQPADASTGPDTPDELVAEPADETWEEPSAPAPAVPATDSQEAREKQETVVRSGKLRTQPKAGRLDRQGRPTAWARLAVPEEGAEQAHLYTATFYRATMAIALGLPRGAEVSVEGYPREGDAARRQLDQFAVLALHDYPGKPSKHAGKGVT